MYHGCNPLNILNAVLKYSHLSLLYIAVASLLKPSSGLGSESNMMKAFTLSLICKDICPLVTIFEQMFPVILLMFG